MELPEYIKSYIEKETTGVKNSDLLKARERLTGNYKSPEGTPVGFTQGDSLRSPLRVIKTNKNAASDSQSKSSRIKSASITTHEDVLSYIITRLPAIYNVIKPLLEKIPGEVKTLLDIGSGPGTVVYAAAETFEKLEKITLIERNRELIQAAKTICKNSGIPILNDAVILTQDIANLEITEKHDLITASYVLNELSEDRFEKLLNIAWEKTDKYLLLVEPGTPEGFGNIKKARETLSNKGGSIMSPCPHDNECPIPEDDWCHFSRRVERSKLLKFMKQGTESYEDEKFSYVLFSKSKVEKDFLRIIRHPFYHKGFVEFKLCMPEGIKKVTVSKKENERYKLARKAEWGDEFK